MFRYLKILVIASMFLASVVKVNAEDMLQIKGSDTLINLVQRLAEEYMEKNPKRYIAVTGGGSGTGIAALINGKCDIANVSRLMTSEEVTRANRQAVDPKRVVIALDGLSIITNIRNSVDKLTREEIGKIFRGDLINWKEVGGSNLPITLYGRQSNSGTFIFFRDMVLKGDYSQRMNHMNGNAQIVEAVKQDASGIGYVGVGYVKDISGELNIVKIASRQGDVYISPLNSSDVKSGKYPFSRPLNQYINGMPKGAIKDFIAFELSEDGQRVVEEEGFFPIPNEYRQFNKKSIGLE